MRGLSSAHRLGVEYRKNSSRRLPVPIRVRAGLSGSRLPGQNSFDGLQHGHERNYSGVQALLLLHLRFGFGGSHECIGVLLRESAAECRMGGNFRPDVHLDCSSLLPLFPSRDLAPRARKVSLLDVPAGIRDWMVKMRRKRIAPSALHQLAPSVHVPLPPLRPYERCCCGRCRECRDNERWDRVFAKFEIKQFGEERGLFQSTLGDL
jgi:hypothetical protein